MWFSYKYIYILNIELSDFEATSIPPELSS